MGLADLANVPNSQQDLAIWASLHMVHHRDILRRVREVYKIQLDEYSLDPLIIDPAGFDNVGSWGYQHQIMHNQMDAVLQIAGNDLTEVNWTDQGERAEWIFLNFVEHQQAGAKLGV